MVKNLEISRHFSPQGKAAKPYVSRVFVVLWLYCEKINIATNGGGGLTGFGKFSVFLHVKTVGYISRLNSSVEILGLVGFFCILCVRKSWSHLMKNFANRSHLLGTSNNFLGPGIRCQHPTKYFSFLPKKTIILIYI